MFSFDQHLSLTLCVFSVAIASFVLILLTKDKKRSQWWAKLDDVGIPSGGTFCWTWALLRSLTSTRYNVHVGYEKFSKTKRAPFAIPTMWTGDAMVVLPPAMLGVLRKPDSEVRSFEALTETLGLPYVISDSRVYTNTIHFDVVRRYMKENKDLDALAAITADEIERAFCDCWGMSQQWKPLKAWDDCGRIITRAATRVLVGLPMCRNKKFEEESRQFSQAVMACSAMVNCFPKFMRGLVGSLMGFRAQYYQTQCLKTLIPFVEERIQLWESKQEGDDVPWLIPQCAKQGPEEMDPRTIATRILTSSIMFISGMHFVFSHCVLDIYDDPLRQDIVSGLEAEARHVNAQHTGISTRNAIGALLRHDSAIRESMRVSDFNVAGLPRDVVSSELDIGNGVKIPQGTRMVFPTQAIHQDCEFYREPARFDAFRFSRDLEGPKSTTRQGPQREELTAITESFLAWGYGRGNCPGRWFASQTMKQALAHMILHYEVEVTKGVGQRRALQGIMLPPTSAKIKIRRRG